MTETTRYKVGISGSFGGLNLGDEAILCAMIQELRRRLPVEIYVYGRDADGVLRNHEVDGAVDIRARNREEARELISHLDLFILGGGGLLYDQDALRYLRDATDDSDVSDFWLRIRAVRKVHR